MQGGLRGVIAQCALAVLAFGLLMQVPAAGATSAGRAQLEQALGARLERERATLQLPGATAAFVLPDGASGAVAVGFADVERRLPMRPDSRMPAGSIGKTFVASLALSLIAQGRLSLDDKLSRWLGQEEWYDRLPNGADIRIRNLLNHSAGIGEHVESKAFVELIRQRVTADADAAIEPRALLGLILDQPPLFAVGQGYKYTDTGYILLQLAIEKAGKVRLWDEVVHRFLYPLQLNATSPAVGRFHAGVAQGYVNAQFLPALPPTTLDNGVFRWNPVSEWAGGGFISSSSDLAHWAAALYEGRTSPSGIGAQMVAPQNASAGRDGYRYGLGVVMRQGEHGRVWGHSGVYPGYRSNMAYYPDCRIAVAVQVNTDRMQGEAMAALGGALARIVLEQYGCHPEAAVTRPTADLLLFNGKIITVDDTFSIRQAVAVSGGRVIAVGGNELASQYQAGRSIDLRGKALLPGFIDTHSHVLAEEFLSRSVNLASIESIGALKAAIARKAKELGPGKWITGNNWSEDLLAEKRKPTRWDLDAAAPANPVILWRTGGHSSVSSSRALRIGGIEPRTAQPPGGIIERRADGEPTGLIRERSDLVADHIPAATAEETRNALIAGLRAHLRYGVTSLINADVSAAEYAVFESIYRSSAASLPRIALQFRPQVDADGSTQSAIEQIKAFGGKTGDGDERMRIGALKIYVDGGFTGAAAYTSEPYQNQPDYFGKLMVPEPELYRLVKYAHDAGWQMGVHTIGDAASQLAVKVFIRVLAESPRSDHRHYLNHMSVMPPREVLAAMAQHGIWVAQQPNFTYTYDALYSRHLGDERLERNNPLRSLLNEGVFFAFGADGVPLDPSVGLFAAVTRKGKVTRRVFGPDERLTMPEALYRYTRAGAYFTREEGLKGSISPGMLADFIVPSEDPLTSLPEKILEIQPLMTIVGGRVLYTAPGYGAAEAQR